MSNIEVRAIKDIVQDSVIQIGPVDYQVIRTSENAYGEMVIRLESCSAEYQKIYMKIITQIQTPFSVYGK